MIRNYDTSAAEERALAYVASLPQAGDVTPDAVFARLVRQGIRGTVQMYRAARDAARSDAYDAADAATKAVVDAALKLT